MIEYRGALTEDDYRECVRLRRRVTKEGGTSEDATLWFGIGFLALAGWGPYSDLAGGNLASLWWLPFALFCFALWWRRRAVANGMWKANPELQEERRGTLSDQSLAAPLGGVDARVPWVLFTGHVASPRVLVLFVGHSHLMLSRTMFASDDEWQRTLALVSERVALPKKPTTLATVILWAAFLLVVFLLWHFARIEKVRP